MMMAVNMDELMDLVGDIIEVDPSKIDLRRDRDDVPGWDSLAHLRLITAFEQQYGVRLSMDQIVEIRTVEQLSRTVNGA
jgi:acyl carrier protein